MLDRGLDLEQLARDAVARGADCLGMAGGDGSQALVASIAVEHELPFVCVSAGTRNHFALDLGLNRDDPRESMYAFRDAQERKVDYATANDRFFVNNVSLGVYAKIVQEESYRDAKVETTKSLLPEMLGRQAEPFDLEFTTPDNEHVDGAILVMVSNNPYVIGASPDNAQRRHLDRGRLGVFAVTTSTGSEAARLFAATALGQRTRSAFWKEFTATEFEVRSRSGTAFAGIDGEALELPTPLRFRIHPRGLTLLVPKGNIEAAEKRRARDVRISDLFVLAAGREPASYLGVDSGRTI
jgi:diacylglycerol kinase family enzyme